MKVEIPTLVIAKNKPRRLSGVQGAPRHAADAADAASADRQVSIAPTSRRGLSARVSLGKGVYIWLWGVWVKSV